MPRTNAARVPGSLGTTYMLVDKDNANVLALRRKAFKGRLDGRIVRLVVNDKKVLLRIWAGCYMLQKTISTVCRRSERCSKSWYLHRCQPAAILSQSPKHEVSWLILENSAFLDSFNACALTSSPITARNCRSLKSAAKADIVMLDANGWRGFVVNFGQLPEEKGTESRYVQLANFAAQLDNSNQ